VGVAVAGKTRFLLEPVGVTVARTSGEVLPIASGCASAVGNPTGSELVDDAVLSPSAIAPKTALNVAADATESIAYKRLCFM
jgi:hypothetical protein